jgi:hypothetical protein
VNVLLFKCASRRPQGGQREAKQGNERGSILASRRVDLVGRRSKYFMRIALYIRFLPRCIDARIRIGLLEC